MSTTQDLVSVIKQELKANRMTYADLAQALEMAESSVKRMLSRGEMPLSRIDAICRALGTDFAELARRVVDQQPELAQLSVEQERAVVADKKLLLVAVNAMSLWSVEQMVAAYHLSEAECVKYLAQLDRLGILELRPMNRYRLKLAKTFKWRPNGPVMQFFREHVALDYLGGAFAHDDEGLFLVHGSISRAAAPALLERMQRLGQDFSQQHLSDQKVPPGEREGYTMILALRRWEYSAFKALRR
ncbi:helix-turn-helix transcriptional regulator [Vandammella animalimorsus]|uniref:Transcriptional regulator n=1 Tax=Vandammella animalimorsus TaxID=2029117 RepID=A0A2A2AZ26_9BURK|nr:helix-turn-helix transcriptional regulator [Vandammella animalimorsus]PAT39841.1 transcriptional regulator [Vandammella animalimorsus]PAT43086.1 transcriptional regulator [Vandammella animalimorsus]RRD64646.1 XRE family transcriptional regulator [Comamonadaceae bacterium OH2310_COT-174]